MKHNIYFLYKCLVKTHCKDTPSTPDVKHVNFTQQSTVESFFG